MEFIIKKLFRKYDVKIKLGEECAILLGANGVGKSTALKILYYALTDNFVDMIFVPFYSICIKGEDGENKELKCKDILPTTQYLVGEYEEHLRRKEYDTPFEEEFYSSQQGSLKTIDILKAEFHVAMHEIINLNRYSEFIYGLYTKKGFPVIIRKILEKYVDIDELMKIDLTVINISNVKYFGGSPYAFSVIKPSFGGLGNNIDRCIMFDAVENYTISNEEMHNSVYFDNDLEWLYSNVEVADGYPETVKRILLKKYEARNKSNQFLVLESPNSFIHIAKDTGVEHQSSKKSVRLNELINRHYYPVDMVVDINNRVSKYVEEYYENIDQYPIGHENEYTYLKEFDEQDIPFYKTVKSFFTDEIIRDYYEYVKPVLIKHSFFDMDFYSDVHDNYEIPNLQLTSDSFIHQTMKKKLLMDYLNEVLPILKDKKNRNKAISNYEEVIKKYLADKYIEVKPCGIQIREGSAITHDSNSVFVLYDSSDIDLSVISSGERKILIIFAVALFEEGILFLDEPELSLSLIWQESLLPDIMKYGNTKGIYVATHSPYISRAEELEQYLTFLPQGNQ